MMRSLISIKDLTDKQIWEIMHLAHEFQQGFTSDALNGKIFALCFFEASTRTRLSFESAIMRLNGKCIGFADSSNLSMTHKQESLVDTIKIVGCLADAIIMRHACDGSARLAQFISGIPVINAGDGANQHPTQTLLDLFSIIDIFASHHNIDRSNLNKNILPPIHLGIMGDLKHSRTVHSLLHVLHLLNVRIYFISPHHLQISVDYLQMLKQASISYSFHVDLNEIIHKLDCLYLTRLQVERMTDSNQDDQYKITLSQLSRAKPHMQILHPLPRVNELPTDIDDTQHAYYFQQAKNGLYVRQALLCHLIGMSDVKG